MKLFRGVVSFRLAVIVLCTCLAPARPQDSSEEECPGGPPGVRPGQGSSNVLEALGE